MAVHVHMQGPEYVELSVIDSNKNVKKTDVRLHLYNFVYIDHNLT
jgi:hypothetical protein